MHYAYPNKSTRSGWGFYETNGYVIGCTMKHGETHGRCLDNRTFTTDVFTTIRADVTCPKCKQSVSFKAATAYNTYLELERKLEAADDLVDACNTIRYTTEDRNEARRFERKLEKARKEYADIAKQMMSLKETGLFYAEGGDMSGPKCWYSWHYDDLDRYHAKMAKARARLAKAKAKKR